MDSKVVAYSKTANRNGYDHITDKVPCTQRTLLLCLPDELLMEILKNLHHKDLIRMRALNKKMRKLASDPELWSSYLIPTRKVALLFGLDVLLKVLKLPMFCKLEALNLNGVLCSVRKKKGIASFETDGHSSKQFVEILSLASTFSLRWLDLGNNDLGTGSKKMLVKFSMQAPSLCRT